MPSSPPCSHHLTNVQIFVQRGGHGGVIQSEAMRIRGKKGRGGPIQETARDMVGVISHSCEVYTRVHARFRVAPRRRYLYSADTLLCLLRCAIRTLAPMAAAER